MCHSRVIQKLKSLYTSNFAAEGITGRTIFSNKQNLENKAFYMETKSRKQSFLYGFYASENQIKEKFKLKT